MRKHNASTLVLAVLLLACMAFSACRGSEDEIPKNLKDGTYTGRSRDHDADESGNGSGYGEVTIEVKDGKIAACTFVMYELDGSVKDETYGAGLSKENRLKAQRAVQSAAKYAEMLVKGGSLDQVDAITGATISCDEFREAVRDALKKAGSGS